MAWSLKDSQLIYDELRNIAATILPKIGCHTEPHEVNGKGRTRTTKWKNQRYLGILFHYTAGVSGIGATRWGNHPGWGNTGSSWHVIIFDRITDDIVGEEWVKIDDEIRRLFPVPTLITADWRWGTWHGNWTCNTTLGIENRNGGYHGYKKAKGGLEGLGKTGLNVGGRIWEPYTREQIICNINLGRLANGWVDGQLDPDWILTHQCVWATKQDTGPLFPIHDLRQLILTDKAIEQIELLGAFKMAPDTDEGPEDEHWKPLDEFRAEAEEDFVKWVQPTPEVEADERDPVWVASQLYKIGFNAGPELPDKETLRKMVRWFQRSTCAYGKDHPEWVLSPDGIVGPKTEAGIVRRLNQLKITV